MKLNNSKRLYRALQVTAAVLTGVGLFAGARIYPPMTEESLREVTIWAIILIVSVITLAIVIVLLTYFRTKAKQLVQESEILEESTKYVFEEGENHDQEK